MKQDRFESLHDQTWQSFEAWIRFLEGDKGIGKRSLSRAEASRFPAMYRQICHHLALARARRYSIGLQQRLNQMALEGHHHLYKSRVPVLSLLLRFFARDFPRRFRDKWRYMLVSGAVFYLPAMLMAVAVTARPELVFSLMNPTEVASMEEMYDPENDVLGRERGSDTDVQMFGFYIYNNITIGFQTFAGGLLFGLGSLFYLVYNGLYFGAVSGHLTAIDFNETFWSFVAGHSAFELTAIVIFGGLGLMLGHAAVAPGRVSRWQAIRNRAKEALPLVYGATVLLVAAAFIEAFWSSTTWPPVALKYTVGVTMWLLLALYLFFMGTDES